MRDIPLTTVVRKSEPRVAGFDQRSLGRVSPYVAAVPPGHLPALDGLRGVAILLVLVFHQNLLGKAGYNGSEVQIFNQLTGLGWCGVTLFFVLSGFLITRILYRERQLPGYFGRFYFRRAVRIFPLYYGLLFVVLVVLPFLPSSLIPPERLDRFAAGQVSSIWYWLHLSNLAMAARGDWGHGILDVAWSLSIEEQFYLLWPLAVRHAERRELMRLALLLMGLAFGIRCALTIGGVSPISIYLLTPCQFGAIAAGAYLALDLESPGRMSWLQRRAGAVWKLSAAVLAGLFLWRGTGNMDPWNQTVGFSLLAVHFTALTSLARAVPSRISGRQRLLQGLLLSPVLRAFGRYSYAIYLFHLPVRGIIRDFVYGPQDFHLLLGSPLPGQMVFYLLTTAATFGAAFVSWHLFEVHFLKLKRFAVPPPPSDPKGPSAPAALVLPRPR